MKVNKRTLIGIVMWLIFAGLASAGTLTSVKTTVAPVIDGTPEKVWNVATAMTVNVTGGANEGLHTVTLKSVYTDDSIYFLAQWNDKTESLRREPWVKQTDNSWKQLKDPDDKGGDDNKFYEDKFAQMWSINSSRFDAIGCFSTCHEGEIGKPYGNKYTENVGEMVDIWHAKLVRTNPSGYIDDQYLDSTRYDKDKSPEAGRKSDPGTVPYYLNINAAKTAPNYTSADQPAPPYWIIDTKKQLFKDTYKANDEIAAIITRPPDGDRADIKAKAVYADGMWTMEYGRKLKTGSQYDVQFSDMKKKYSFGTAIFDGAQVRHSFEQGVSKLVFAGVAEEITPTETVPEQTKKIPSPSPVKTPGFEILFTVLVLSTVVLIRRR